MKEKVRVYFYDGVPRWMPSPLIRVYMPFLIALFTVLLPIIGIIKVFPDLIHNFKTAFEVMFLPHDKKKPFKIKRKKWSQ